MSSSSREPVSNSETVHALAYALRGKQRTAFERRLIAVLHDDIFRRREGLTSSEQCALSYERFQYLHERLDLSIANLFGDTDNLLALHRWVATVDGTLVTLLTIHFNLCIGTILELGEQRTELKPILDELDRLDTVGVFLATELAHGNNVQALETEAVFDPRRNEFVLSTPAAQAQKFMPNTAAEGVPKLAVVMARLLVASKDCGVFPFLVRIRTEEALCQGVQVTALGEKPDYALDNGVTSFHGVRIPKHHWLSGNNARIDEHGQFHNDIGSHAAQFLISMNRVQNGKLCLSMAALSFMHGSLQLAVRYSQQRKTFGPGRSDVPLMYYTPHHHELLVGIATSYAGAFLARQVAGELQSALGKQSLALTRAMAVTKVFLSARSLATTSMCRERIGAQGLFAANRIITYWIYSNGIVTAEGDNAVLKVKTARELLTRAEYIPPSREAFSRASFQDADSESLVGLIKSFERTIVDGLSAVFAGLSPSQQAGAWNIHLPRSMELAELHCSRLALEAFVAAIEDVEDERARDLLQKLCRLFALGEIESRLSALLIEDLVSVEIASGLSAAREELCASLLEDIDLLVDGFGMPDGLLDAPIGGDFVAAFDFMSKPVRRESGFIWKGEPAERAKLRRLVLAR